MAGFVMPVHANAATESLIYNFSGSNGAVAPFGGLVVAKDGSLYGVSREGGSACASPGCGIFYRLVPPAAGQTAWTQQDLYAFAGGSDGQNPMSTLVPYGKAGYLGTTQSGGANGRGTIFELVPPTKANPAWTEIKLLDLAIAYGAQSVSGMVRTKKGSYYGVTQIGGNGTCQSAGTVVGCGVFFELTPPAAGQSSWSYDVIYAFQGQGDGASPWGTPSITPKGSVLVATTAAGSAGFGSVVEFTPPTKTNANWAGAIVYEFTGGSDGGTPLGQLYTAKTGVVYGTAEVGGTYNLGTVFSLSPPARGSKSGWAFNTLYSFEGAHLQEPGLGSYFDGAYPSAGVVMDKTGALYGTTQQGGNIAYECANGVLSNNGCGTVFKLTPPAAGQTTWSESVVDGFSYCCDGYFPFSTLTLSSAGTLYGTTPYGGSRTQGVDPGSGTAFQVTTP
jgi:hypothetical protein